MTPEQVELAKKNIEKLNVFVREMEKIEEFIKALDGSGYLSITTSYQNHLDLPTRILYNLIGKELVELLKVKLYERNGILFKTEAVDLLKAIETNEQPSSEATEAGKD